MRFGWQASQSEKAAGRVCGAGVGGLAQLGERLVCNQEVTGSSPVFSTSLRSWQESAMSYGWQAS